VVRIGANGREVVERPTVVQCRPLRELRWRTRLGFPWLLDTERAFKLERLGPTRTRFVHWQTRSGLLAVLRLSASQSATREHFDVMNFALKARVEHGARWLDGPTSRSASQERDAIPGPDDRGHQMMVAPT
jgi:hypothetical protein